MPDLDSKIFEQEQARVWKSDSDHLCGPVEGFVWPSLCFTVVKVVYVLSTCPYFDNLEFDIFGAGCPKCNFITSDFQCSYDSNTFSILAQLFGVR